MNLRHCRTFETISSQGITGLLKTVDSALDDGDLRPFFGARRVSRQLKAVMYFYVLDEPHHPSYVFKLSKEVDTLVDHELKISRDLEELTTYLPHFNTVLEVHRNVPCYLPENVDRSIRRTYNPFQAGTVNCFRDVSISEYIPSETSLLDHVKKHEFKCGSKELLHQLMLGLFIAQQTKNFCHYDMHLDNVLVRRCLKRTFFWYKFLYQGIVLNRLVYTDGYFPVVFDYGSAHSSAVIGTCYNSNLRFTNKGHTPYAFDDTVDFRILLVRLANVRHCPEELKNVVSRYFTNTDHPKVKVDKRTGWLVLKERSCAKKIHAFFEAHLDTLGVPTDSFVRTELDGVVDLLGILVRPPFDASDEPSGCSLDSVRVFVREWSKIDEWFNSPDDKLNILKSIFCAVNRLIVNSESFSDDDEMYDAMRMEAYKIFDEFGEFAAVENVDYRMFMGAIIDMSNAMETICREDVVQRRKTLERVPIPSAWTILEAVEQSVVPQNPYKFKRNDSIVLFDCVNKFTTSFDLIDDDILSSINDCFNLKDQIMFLNNLEFTN